MNLFFDCANYNNNKAYEKPITKFLIYVYFIIITYLILSEIILSKEELKQIDDILQVIDEYLIIFVNVKKIKFIEEMHLNLK